MLLLLSLILAASVNFIGCANVAEGTNNSIAKKTEPDPAGKLPITTASEEARKEFLQGRDLNEKLLIQDSIAHFDKAISLDPNFAMAELSRALVSPTGKEFFEHLKKAVSLADKASPGEKLLILGTEAGANGNTAKQKEYLEQLIAAFPNDERGLILL
jgi:tetratricopeptide (TPR) repeat protein